jgi:hypothetical protein
MRYGLLRASEELKDEIEKYKIFVDVEGGYIGRGNVVMPIPYGMSREICKRHIRSYIKQAKDEIAAKLLENQARLL